MTKQEFFDRCFQHFVVNQAPQAIGSHGCLYRTPEGHKCAIGIFLPDELPFPEGEVMGFINLADNYPALVEEVFGELVLTAEGRNFLQAGQTSLHDSILSGSDRYAIYKDFAEREGLLCPERPAMEVPS